MEDSKYCHFEDNCVLIREYPTMAKFEGTNNSDVISGTIETDIIDGFDGDDVISGGLGDDVVDGGAGENTYVVQGSADSFQWSVDSLGNFTLTDLVVSDLDPIDGSDEGTDTLLNIQAIKFDRGNGFVETVIIDDYSNLASVNNPTIAFGARISGRVNYYADRDFFNLTVKAGQEMSITNNFLSSASRLTIGSYLNQGMTNGKSYFWTPGTTETIEAFVDGSLSSSSPNLGTNFDFTIRRVLRGDADEEKTGQVLSSEGNFEHIVGGAGNDLISGSGLDDLLEGGGGADTFNAGAGDDFLIGGDGLGDVAIFSGNQSEYQIGLASNLNQYSGASGALGLRVADTVDGRDGVNLLDGVEILRFADGDFIVDAQPNQKTLDPTFESFLGDTITGDAVMADSGFDVDYYQVRLDGASFSTGDQLRLEISLESPDTTRRTDYLRISFNKFNDVSALKFKNIETGETVTEILLSKYVYSGANFATKVLALEPVEWSDGSPFDYISQRLDVKVEAYTNLYDGVQVDVGQDRLSYSIKLSEVAYGTIGDDAGLSAIVLAENDGTFVDGLSGNDEITGTDRVETIYGGTGNDIINAMGGDDLVVDGQGSDLINAGIGNDVVDISLSTVPSGTYDGGEGEDTLLVANSTDLSGASFTSFEWLEGIDPRTISPLSPEEVAAIFALGARNIIFNATANNSYSVDASNISGAFDLGGSFGSDTLIGNDEENTIYILGQRYDSAQRFADPRVGFQTNQGMYGHDIVRGEGGDDTIIWGTGGIYTGSLPFTAGDNATRIYELSGVFDGGAGSDRLVIDYNTIWRDNNTDSNNFTKPWTLDLSKLTLTNIETLEFRGYSQSNPYTGATSVILTADQLMGLTSLIGSKEIKIIGGGSLDLAHLKLIGAANWRIFDDSQYSITGSGSNDNVTLSGYADTSAAMGAGDDSLILQNIQNKLAGTLSGGEGFDTLTLRGTDIDASLSAISEFEKISIDASSFTLTQNQWDLLNGIVQASAGSNAKFLLKLDASGSFTLEENSIFSGVVGGSGADLITGNAANNIIGGGAGDDIIQGQLGDDRLLSGEGIDQLLGGKGDDILVAYAKTDNTDTLDGGEGIDTIEINGLIDLSLAKITNVEGLAGSGTVILEGPQLEGISLVDGVKVKLSEVQASYDFSHISLSNGAQIILPGDVSATTVSADILGSKDAETITAGDEGIILAAGGGVDTIQTGSGDDIIYGGAQADIISSGAGDDLFIVASEEKVLDFIDGGQGTDTLQIQVTNERSYTTLQGLSSQNVENLQINYETGANYFLLDALASEFSKFQSIVINNGDPGQHWEELSLKLTGAESTLSLDALREGDRLNELTLLGSFDLIDARNADPFRSVVYASFSNAQFSELDDLVYFPLGVAQSNAAISLGAGDDIVVLDRTDQYNLTARLAGGEGYDTIKITNNGFVDFRGSTFDSIEALEMSSGTIALVDEENLSGLDLIGSGKIYSVSGGVIFGTSANDIFSGNYIETFEGGAGDDNISNVKLVKFSGNKDEYDITQSGRTITVQHARGEATDGTDTLTDVRILSFADVQEDVRDDYADSRVLYGYYQGLISREEFEQSLERINYFNVASKSVSGRMDSGPDIDSFLIDFVPNSPVQFSYSSGTSDRVHISAAKVSGVENLYFKHIERGYVVSSIFQEAGTSAAFLPVLSTPDGYVEYEGGEVVLSLSSYDFTGATNYTFSVNYLDDFRNSIDTTAVIDPSKGAIKGYVGDLSDKDWVRTELVAGTEYVFKLQGAASGNGSLVDPALSLYSGSGALISTGLDAQTNVVGGDDLIKFRPSESGSYFLEVSDAAGLYYGSWTLTQESLDAVAGNVSTSERIELSSSDRASVYGEINQLGDHDWYKVWLDAGLTYRVRVLGESSGQTLTDPDVSVRSATGTVLAFDDNGGTYGTDAELAFSPSVSGWYFVDVGGSGNSNKGSFKLELDPIPDDYSNDLSTTGIVTISGTPKQGLISYRGDSDWLKVGLSGGSTYVIKVVGDESATALLDPLSDPRMIVRDAFGQKVFETDDFAGSLDPTAFFTPDANGTFYVEVVSNNKFKVGAYAITVDFAPSDDHVNLISEAASTASLGVASNGEISEPGDRDVFQMDLAANNVYKVQLLGIAASAGSLLNPYLRVFDTAGNLIAFDDNGGDGLDSSLYFSPAADGTYYFEASASKDKAMGTYQIKVEKSNLDLDLEPNDISTQVSLEPGDQYAGNLLTKNDQDWFKINLEAGKNYVFRAKAADSGNGTLENPKLELRDALGGLIDTMDDSLTSRDAFIQFQATSSGTFHLVVLASDGDSDTGTYVLSARAPDDHSNARLNATEISLDVTAEGGIQYSDGTFGVRAIDTVGSANDIDQDWFKFDVVSGQQYSFIASPKLGSTLSRTMIEITDSQGNIVVYGDGLETIGGTATASFVPTSVDGTDGSIVTYYAKVIDGAGAVGDYSVTLVNGDITDEDNSSTPDVFQPVEISFVTSGEVTQAEYNGKLGLAGDTDTFEIALQASSTYRIETFSYRDGSSAPLSSANVVISYSDTVGSNAAISGELLGNVGEPTPFPVGIVAPETDGRLSIVISGVEAYDTGAYGLRIIDLGILGADDRPSDVATYDLDQDGTLAINETVTGTIEEVTDRDLFAVSLTAGQIYDLTVLGATDALGTLSEPTLSLLNQSGQLVSTGRFDAQAGQTKLSVSVFEDGQYYVAVGAAEVTGNIGTYTLDTRLRGADDVDDDYSADTKSGGVVLHGQPLAGAIDYAGDYDWVRTDLEAGKTYVVDLIAAGDGAGGTLGDGTLRLLDSFGNELAIDDNSGPGNDAHIQFSAPTSGTYFLEAGGKGTSVGSYTLRLRELYSGVADPLRSAQWYLDALGISKLNGQITGAGVNVSVVDDGIDIAHPDLVDNMLLTNMWDTQFNVPNADHKIYKPDPNYDAHGTPVAGLIAAVANNETGLVGVAQDADLTPTRVKWAWGHMTEAMTLQYQFDVSNNSWGAKTPFGDDFNSPGLTFAYLGLRRGVEDGRDGLGTVFVFSAGNSDGTGDNTNYHNFQNAREVLTVGALEQDGTPASFSTPGANVLVSTYGVGLITTDWHEPGQGYNIRTLGDYTKFSGTSAAAPVVSGVVALMLEANPNLGYRDVQKILAYSAQHSSEIDWKENGANDWNLSGLKFNDKVGFGSVDAYAAVQLAKTWQKTETSINEISASARAFGLSEAIPDGNGEVYEKTFTINSSLSVEHVELGVDLRHVRMSDLIVELVSPNGTVSKLMDRVSVTSERPFGLYGPDSGVPTHLLWDFSSVQFWGEDASGEWKIRITDAFAENKGIVSSLSLRVFGARDDGNDTYIFTDEGFRLPVSKELSDDNGHDAVNAAAVTYDIFADLEQGHISANLITNKFSSWTEIEDAYTGSGNDRLVGNKLGNKLWAGDGNDLLEGGAGDDALIGGSGFDTVKYSGKRIEYTVSWDAIARTVTVVDVLSSNGDDGTDVLSGIERLVFADAEMLLQEMVGGQAPVANTTFFDTPVMIEAGAGIDFDIPEDAFTVTQSEEGESNFEIVISSASGSELPDWLSYDPETGRFTGVPPEGFQGQLKLLVTAIDDFGNEVSEILVLQFGDNLAPIVEPIRELVLSEDVGDAGLNIPLPVDPEGSVVTITVNEVPTVGDIVDGLGVVVKTGDTLSADMLSQLHYRSAQDQNGSVGKFLYTATDADGVSADGGVDIFLTPLNDAPRFATNNSKLIVNYPAESSSPIELLSPIDAEETITSVTIRDLPTIGIVSLYGVALEIGQVVAVSDLGNLQFDISENVNGPIGGITIQAVDSDGAAGEWTLNIEVQGENYSNRGTAGPDEMYGSIGADELYGLGGNDTIVGNAGDDLLAGGLGDDFIFGGLGSDIIDGSAGHDELDGGSGSDIMAGGPGNDTYYVENAGDLVIETLSTGAGGNDLVVSEITYTAPTNVEDLLAIGEAAIDLTGNASDNKLVGNAARNLLSGLDGNDYLFGKEGNDVLDGGSGVDRMIGGKGDDTYYVNSKFDQIIEASNEGYDEVFATSSYTLSSNIEKLTALGADNINLGGNSLDNHLIGNDGDNILAGGLGYDVLEGGLGNDIYYVGDYLDDLLDTGGFDTVRSTIDYTLGGSFEALELIGMSSLTANGNSGDNLIKGNSGDNVLDGKGGVDTLYGAGGSDQFIFTFNGPGVGVDSVGDFEAGEDLAIIDLFSFGANFGAMSGATSGLLSAGSFVKGAGAVALDPDDYFVLDTATGILKFDSDGSYEGSSIDVLRFVEKLDDDIDQTSFYLVL